MTQNGVVTRLLADGRAEVAVERGTACGGNCSGGCEACVYANRLLVSAENPVYAKPGDRVILESRTDSIMGATLLVYMLPLAFMLAGLAVATAAALRQGLVVLVTLLSAGVGGAATVFIGRRKKEIAFRITGYCR